jgi:uncharacterized protein YkwD
MYGAWSSAAVRAFDAKLLVATAGVIVVLGGIAWLLRPADRSPDPIAEMPAVSRPSEQKTPRAGADPPAPVLKAKEILAAINASRANERLTPLAMDERVTAAAQEKLDDMLRRHYFDHQNPEGKYIWDSLRRRCAFRRTAENLARGIADAGAMEKTWLSSPQHRDNLLNPNFRLTGIAVAQNPLTAVVLFADACG